MNFNRFSIPSHIISNVKNSVKSHFEKSLLKKNSIDSYIFLNKKIIQNLSKYILLKSLTSINLFEEHVNFKSEAIINNETYHVYEYIEKDEFIYIQKTNNEIVHVIIKFINDLKYGEIVYQSSFENLINDFKIDLSDKQMKILVNNIEDKIKI